MSVFLEYTYTVSPDACRALLIIHRSRRGFPSGLTSPIRIRSRSLSPEIGLLVLGIFFSNLKGIFVRILILAYCSSFTKLMQEDGHTLNLPFPTRPVPTPSVDLQREIVNTSHEFGMLTVAHALTNHSTLSVLEAGVDGLAHASIEPITEEVIKAFKKNNAFLIPTLAVHASCSGEEQESREKFSAHLEGTAKEHLLGCLHITREEFSIKSVYEQVYTLKDAGIDIIW